MKFYKEVAISLKGSTGYFFFKPKTVGSGMEVDEDNIINIIIRKIDKSGLKKYATKHKKSSVYKWYEYLLENIEKISQELTAYESKLDMSDKIKLTKMLESVQEMMYNRTSELLDLEKYVDSHNIEKSSLGAVVHGNTYGLYRENVENIIKLRLKSLWVKCTELVGLEPPKYTG